MVTPRASMVVNGLHTVGYSVFRVEVESVVYVGRSPP